MAEITPIRRKTLPNQSTHCVSILVIYKYILICFYLIFMSVRWDVKWCPVSRITRSMARKRPFHWISMKSRLVRAVRETNDHRLLIITTVIWPKYCRYGVKHHIINQSIIQSTLGGSLHLSIDTTLQKMTLDGKRCFFFVSIFRCHVGGFHIYV